jgi:hypothetical protein
MTKKEGINSLLKNSAAALGLRDSAFGAGPLIRKRALDLPQSKARSFVERL